LYCALILHGVTHTRCLATPFAHAKQDVWRSPKVKLIRCCIEDDVGLPSTQCYQAKNIDDKISGITALSRSRFRLAAARHVLTTCSFEAIAELVDCNFAACGAKCLKDYHRAARQKRQLSSSSLAWACHCQSAALRAKRGFKTEMTCQRQQASKLFLTQRLHQVDE
jgi:hypothetical protein